MYEKRALVGLPLAHFAVALYVGIMKALLAIVIGLASPLVAVEVVKGVLYVLSRFEGLAAEVSSHDATIVQSALELCSSHSTWVAIALAAYAIYATRSRRSKGMKQLLASAGQAAALVTPASIYLLR